MPAVNSGAVIIKPSPPALGVTVIPLAPENLIFFENDLVPLIPPLCFVDLFSFTIKFNSVIPSLVWVSKVIASMLVSGFNCTHSLAVLSKIAKIFLPST